MKRLKRILSLLLVLVLCWSLVPTEAFASNSVCRNRRTNVEYETLAEAVNDASDGDTIVVTRDCTVDTAIVFDKSINIEGATGSEVISRNTAVNRGRIFGGVNNQGPQINVSFKNIILDGGAKWSTSESDWNSANTRTDANTPAIEALLVFGGLVNVTLNLNEGTVIQNCNTYRDTSMSVVYSAGAVCCENYNNDNKEVNVNGAVIRNCSSGGNTISESGGINCLNYDNDKKIRFNMNDTLITGCASYGTDANTGGALFLASCDSKITNSQFVGNYALEGGGGITQRWGVCTITDSVIKENYALTCGGAMLLYTSADCTLKGSTVISDNESSNGGAIELSGNSYIDKAGSKLAILDNVKLLRNKASRYGGALMTIRASNIYIGEHVEIALNEATRGGGIYESASGSALQELDKLEIQGSIYQNKASIAGADIYAPELLGDKIVLPIAGAMGKAYLDSSGNSYRITNWHYDYQNERFDPISNVTGIYPNEGLKAYIALVAAGVKEDTWNVKYDNGNDSVTGSQIDDTDYNDGDIVTVKDAGTMAWEGHFFKGWNTRPDGSGTKYAPGDTFNITENTTLYAMWDTYYTVNYNMNGHGTQITGQTIENGNKATRPADPTAEGFTFGGWYTDSACQTLYDFNSAVTGNVVLYAKWTKNEPPAPVYYTVNYNMNGHGEQITGETVESGNKATRPADPTAEGFTFGGWYTDATCETLYNFENAVTGNVVLFAKWTQNEPPTPPEPIYYTVGFNMNGHGEQIAGQTIENGNKATRPADPTAEGFTFGGWYTDATCETLYNFENAVTGNVVLYAKWTQNEPPAPPEPIYYTVGFNMNGHGVQIAGQTIENGNKATRPADPTAEGFTFGGWYTDSTCQTLYDFESAVTGNVVLYAKWTKNENPPTPPEPNPPVPTPPTPANTLGNSSHTDNAPVVKSNTNSIKSTALNSPKTGEEDSVMLWVLILVTTFSSMALTGTVIYSRIRKNNN